MISKNRDKPAIGTQIRDKKYHLSLIAIKHAEAIDKPQFCLMARTHYDSIVAERTLSGLSNTNFEWSTTLGYSISICAIDFGVVSANDFGSKCAIFC